MEFFPVSGDLHEKCMMCTVYLESAWELNNYLNKLYCVSVLYLVVPGNPYCCNSMIAKHSIQL